MCSVYVEWARFTRILCVGVCCGRLVTSLHNTTHRNTTPTRTAIGGTTGESKLSSVSLSSYLTTRTWFREESSTPPSDLVAIVMNQQLMASRGVRESLADLTKTSSFSVTSFTSPTKSKRLSAVGGVTKCDAIVMFIMHGV